jgi:hypothetical protein
MRKLRQKKTAITTPSFGKPPTQNWFSIYPNGHTTSEDIHDPSLKKEKASSRLRGLGSPLLFQIRPELKQLLNRV